MQVIRIAILATAAAITFKSERKRGLIIGLQFCEALHSLNFQTSYFLRVGVTLLQHLLLAASADQWMEFQQFHFLPTLPALPI